MRWWGPVCALALGCGVEPLSELCPDVRPGELVITEVRGPQGGPDTRGQWVELYNRSGSEVDLAGLQLDAVALDGSGEQHAIVRDSLVVPDGAYVVLGLGDSDLPEHMDYAFGLDIESDLHSAGLLEVFACDRRIDALLYTSLPAEGTLILDGSKLPSTAANDDAACLCADEAPAPPDGPQTELGIPGSPGEENPPCDG